MVYLCDGELLLVGVALAVDASIAGDKHDLALTCHATPQPTHVALVHQVTCVVHPEVPVWKCLQDELCERVSE